MLKKFLRGVLRVTVVAILCLCAIGLLVARPTFVTGVQDITETVLDADKLQQHVVYLSETIFPRNSAHPEQLEKASDYIKSELSQFTPEVSFQNYSVEDVTYRNVIAKFGRESETVIVVGAHYDAYLELPGADDNASGVAGLIELGRLLSSVSLKQQVLLVAYTLEEPPFYASETMGSFVHATSLSDKKVELMISLEMIGYFSDEEQSQKFPVSLLSLIYPTRGNYIAIVDRMQDNNAVGLKSSINKYTDLSAYSINAPASIVGIDFSDHRSYWKYDFPAVMVTDTSFYRNIAYHTKYDTYERLDYQSMAKVVYGVFKYVQEIANEL